MMSRATAWSDLAFWYHFWLVACRQRSAVAQKGGVALRASGSSTCVPNKQPRIGLWLQMLRRRPKAARAAPQTCRGRVHLLCTSGPPARELVSLSSAPECTAGDAAHLCYRGPGSCLNRLASHACAPAQTGPAQVPGKHGCCSDVERVTLSQPRERAVSARLKGACGEPQRVLCGRSRAGGRDASTISSVEDFAERGPQARSAAPSFSLASGYPPFGQHNGPQRPQVSLRACSTRRYHPQR